MNTISGVYKITNTITGDFYIESSKDVKKRWAQHKRPSTWNNNPNSQLYLDMKKYGLDKFDFEILAEAESNKLKEMEQQFIELLKPTYNNRNANGLNVERIKKYQIEYYQQNCEKRKKYQKSGKGKKSHRKASNKYDNQLCCYNGETLTLQALRMRFRRKGIPHPTIEAKKYLIL